MSSRRSRSRSPRRDRDRSRTPDDDIQLPNNASPISESDYFQKSDEFRIWLKDDKGKYFDELSGDRARSYFRKFVKAWNRGKLRKSLYAGIDPSTISATAQTGYKWSFASKKTRADDEALRAAREEISAATYNREPSSSSHAGPSRPGRVQGPTLPSASDLALSRELAGEQQQEERAYKRKRDKLEAKERVEEMVGPKEVGREGMLEKKRARRDADRSFREKGDEGLEADESTLLGGGDSFRDQIAKRDAAKSRFNAAREEKAAAARERATAIKQKEQATMDMFQQMAKQRFG
ncbi:hypothetical protein DXG03_009133 [Asterophora parasitica]|uniref:Uncharacterized protein n=1 Tax=Asterophora parasitica TaxID=117018 RepID=A0A9P7KCF9_9AGAR|nr:hypothetical protein DXG03_009133 [Asterophora parasitica]